MENEPTAELIRTQLRRLRLRAELSQEEFGKLVHFSGSQVSAVELGHRPLDRFFLRRADEVLGTGGLLMSLLTLAERDTDDMLAEQEAERRLAVRLDRQAVLAVADPPKFVAVIEETVLRRADESFRGLMSQQVAHLIEASSHPHIAIHIIPADVGLHIGLTGPFTLARGADGGWLGYLENQLGGTVIDKDEDVAILLSRWESVRSEALSRRQSIELMKEVVESWS
ncbi:DUF5753 domain-containing protein [Micromonospora sp. NPDC005686]|uniref:DUF5753 domain-containing protein n=1 Tax=unclassified Micromonospora TaxID=2617518 RepID=UPI0033B1C1FA